MYLIRWSFLDTVKIKLFIMSNDYINNGKNTITININVLLLPFQMPRFHFTLNFDLMFCNYMKV